MIVDITPPENYTAEQALSEASGWGFKDICIIGWNEQREFLSTSSKMTNEQAILLIEIAKKILLDNALEEY